MPEDIAGLGESLRQAFKADRTATTVVLARRILKLNPRDAATWARLGSALTNLANFDEAEVALRNALVHCEASKRILVYTQLGHLFHHRGDYATATEWFERVIELDPTDAAGHIYLGGSLAMQGKLEEAEASHRNAAECTSGCIDEAYHNIGLLLRAQGRLEESAVCFRRALDIDPEYSDSQLALDDVTHAMCYSTRSGRPEA